MSEKLGLHKAPKGLPVGANRAKQAPVVCRNDEISALGGPGLLYDPVEATGVAGGGIMSEFDQDIRS